MPNLVIQIPCYNEAQTLRETIKDLPTALPGVDQVRILVVDDGSTDDTSGIALAAGADFVVRHRRNRGLAHAFMSGLRAALAQGADIVVNTDADHQYPGRYIPALIAPILAGTAELVIGDRQPIRNVHFSPAKRLLEWLGSWVIRGLSQTDSPDAASGFRAYSRYAALRMHVYNDYSYTLETLIQAGRERLAIAHIPIDTNPPLRDSRLHGGLLSFIWRQSGTIIRAYVLYQPLRSFLVLGIPAFLAGAFLIARFLYFYLTGDSGVGRHLQSLSVGGTLTLFGLLLALMGLLADAVRANRTMMQEILTRLRHAATTSPDAGELSEDGSTLLRRADSGSQDPG
jgi:glycosyltransferase involved in cell wall biosynthesis